MSSDTKLVRLDDLRLDSANPRLPESVDREQSAMIDYIATTTSIEELMQAIGENGYFPGEPLIVVPDPQKNGKFVVVEGNRRLTALMLLRDPKNCSNPGSKIREIASSAKYHPDEIPVVIQAQREDVLPYLGFRHITGVKQWEPLAKARYIKQLFDGTDANYSPRDRYSIVARAIGSRRDHIKRNLDALAVYREIKDKDFYEIDGLDEETIKFAVLSTALADDRIGHFVGVSKKVQDDEYLSQDPIVNPKSLHKDEIAELTRWLFKRDEKGRTRVGESRNLRSLAAVVDNSKALKAFRANSPLKIAFQMTADSTADFVSYLYNAETALTEAAGMVATVPYTVEAYEVALRLLENVKLIGKTLKSKNVKDDDGF